MQASSHKDFLESIFRNELAHLSKLNHVSGCGHDTVVLQDRIIAYLRNHNGDWHVIYDVISDRSVQGWVQFGKHIVDPTLLLMAGAGFIELDALPVPRMMRLR